MIKGFEDIKVLYQFLYQSEEHYIEIPSVTGSIITLHMSQECRFIGKNSALPDIPEIDYTCDMSIPMLLQIIQELKNTPAIEFPKRFENRWEEIMTISNTNVALNMKISFN